MLCWPMKKKEKERNILSVKGKRPKGRFDDMAFWETLISERLLRSSP